MKLIHFWQFSGETSSNEAKKSPEPSTSSAKTQAQTRVVVFSKTEEGIDFSLSGGIPMVGTEEKLPICISHIKPGGVADRVGGLKIGDQLISVNGVSVEGQRRELANELLKMNSSVKLVVRYTPKGKANFSVKFFQTEWSNFVFTILSHFLLV